MKARVSASLLAICLLSACGGPEAPWESPPATRLALRSSHPPEKIPLLEPFDIRLDLYRASGVEVDFAPEVPEEDFACDVESGPERPLGEGVWRRTTLHLRPLRGPGTLSIPSFTARARDGSEEVTIPGCELEVTSLLEGHGDEIEPPAAPFPAPVPYLRIGLIALAVSIGLFLLYRYARRRPGLRGAGDAVAPPPHIVALRALHGLRSAPRSSTEEIEAFYVAVSDVLRHYVEDAFGLRAPEMTTEEFLHALESSDSLVRAHRAELQRFLSQCDFVKFARHTPSASDHEATLSTAESFVEKTRTDREVPAGEVVA